MRLRHIKEADPAIQASPYCISQPEAYKGKWNTVFHKNRPMELEIGMGKGRFLLEKAMQNPQINYIGLERYSSVLYRALQKLDSLEETPENLLFLCEDARSLNEFFRKGEIRKIYLNFSDPWPKDRHAKRRLTSSTFLEIYAELLESGASIEFKTDNRPLFDFSVESIWEFPGFHIEKLTYDLHHDTEMNQGNILTEYEEKFSAKGNPIFKLIAVRD